MSVWGSIAVVASLGSCTPTAEPEPPGIFSSDAFTLYANSVTEGPFTARAESGMCIVSDYSYTDSMRCRPTVRLRFCLNGRDNEMSHAVWHTAHIVPGDSTPVMVFGSTEADSLRFSPYGIAPSMRNRWTVRLDMRPVLRALARDGYYVTPASDTIFRQYFKGVWVTGPDEPFTADVRTLHGRPDMQLLDHGDSTYLLTFNLRSFMPVRFDAGVIRTDSVPRSMPEIHSKLPLADAVFNLAAVKLNGLLNNPNTLRIPLSTTEISHSAVLSLALLDPAKAKRMLRKCVADGRIVQDAGAGGAWPVSADRLMWIVAAREVFLADGDRDWLREAERIARRTLEADRHVLLDRVRNLYHGAPSSPSFGPRNYPEWASPRDLYQSMSLRVNAIRAMAVEAYQAICSELGKTVPDELVGNTTDIADAINFALWSPALNRYAAFLYGGFYPVQSPCADNLGQALAVKASVAYPEMARALIRYTPVSPYGPATNTPVADTLTSPSMANVVQPHISVWWALAAAKAQSRQAVEATIAAFWRNYAFSLGHGYVNASTGRPLTAVPHSQIQAQSAAMALTLRLLAGIRLDNAGMRFEPYMPPMSGGSLRIERLRYRQAILDVVIHGYGNTVQSATIDGQRIASGAHVSPELTGHHKLRIFMMNNRMLSYPVNQRAPQVMPSVPRVSWTSDHQARIVGFRPSDTYIVSENGVTVDELQRADFSMASPKGFTTVGFAATGTDGLTGYLTRQHLVMPRNAELIVDAHSLGQPGTSLPVAEGRADSFLELSAARNLNVEISLRSPTDAVYFFDVRYLNGSGQADAQTRCVIRTLLLNGEPQGVVVMPCLGEGNWFTEAYSNVLTIRLKKGINRINLKFTAPYDANASRGAGTALIHNFRLIRKQ